jgi:hypothetical protein
MDTPDVAPPPVQMVQLLAGFQVSQALYAAAKLGLPDALADAPRHVADLAESLSLDPAALGRLARSLSGLGVLSDKGDGCYGLTPLGETLTSGAPGSMRDLALMWMETHYAPFAGLHETVRTGRSAAETYYGKPFFAWLADHPEQVDRFTGAMANLTSGIKVAAVTGQDWSASRRILDVGGADGTLLTHVLTKQPGITGTVLDLPHVVPAVARTAKLADLEGRLDAVAGDFFTEVPGGYDTYVMSMVLHDWDDEHAGRLLSNIAGAAAAGSKVYAFELVVPPGDTPHMATMIDLTMLGMLDGRERTEPELRRLVEQAGLRYVGTTPTASPLSVISAEVA